MLGQRSYRLPQRPPVWFCDWLLENFAKADLNGNGQLSKEELEQLKAKYAVEDKNLFRTRSRDRGPDHRRLLERYPEADTDGDVGQIAGSSSVPGGEVHACLWDGGTTTDLGTLGGTQGWATAIDEPTTW